MGGGGAERRRGKIPSTVAVDTRGNVRNRDIDGLKPCTTATRSGFGLGSTGLQAVGVPLTTMVVWVAVARNAGEGSFRPPSLWIRGSVRNRDIDGLKPCTTEACRSVWVVQILMPL
ncbi:MAG TPA: hypothetical protein VFB34_12775 [Chloroflexota bacterium]|nr:hypothetical protein [Chloroflexota bacterium]